MNPILGGRVRVHFHFFQMACKKKKCNKFIRKSNLQFTKIKIGCLELIMRILFIYLYIIFLNTSLFHTKKTLFYLMFLVPPLTPHSKLAIIKRQGNVATMKARGVDLSLLPSPNKKSSSSSSSSSPNSFPNT